jgi:formate dehydrogenase alpha subunit
VAGLAATFGSGAMTNSIDELTDADVIFVIGSNTPTAHPLVATRLFRARAKGGRVIVVDPRGISLRKQADLYVQHKLGTDAALINGIMYVILKEGWENKAFIESRTEGFDAFRAVVDQYPPERVSQITGVSEQDIRTMAEWYAKAEKASIVYCMGITQHTTGVDNVKSLANLSMLTGQIGRESTGVNPLRGQNNVQGACDMGGLPNVYPGYQPVLNEAVREKFGAAWKAEGWEVSLDQGVGLTIPDMLHALDHGEMRALYVVGENPVMSDPDQHHVEQALAKAELLVVQDIFLTETARMAHVVLPGCSYAEKDGTFSNTERRVQRVRAAVKPVGQSRPDWEIIQDLSNRFGYPMHFESPARIMEEITQVTPQYAGIRFDRLEGEGIAWPCPTLDHPGTRFLHKDKFVKGLGTFFPIEFKPPAETPDPEYPMWLTTGRAHVHYHTGTMTRNSPTLHAQMPDGYVELNPAKAREIGVEPGGSVRLSTRRGSITAAAMVTERVPADTVFVTFHFIEANGNVLTNTALDPIVKIPEFKVCAVRVEAA